jgi:small conductance mechanosensitive channel
MNESPWATQAILHAVLTYSVPFILRLFGAVVIWIVGRMIIGGVQRVAARGLEHRKMDPTLGGYVRSMIGVTLTLLLLLAILTVFGVEPTSFAGLLAAGGVAFGMAWSGLLSNFAAGVFLVILRPYQVGDTITAGGVTGVVREIGLFATTLDTGDNIRNFVGNAKIFGDTIQNFSANPYRRVDLKAQLAHGVDLEKTMGKLRARLPEIPHVVKDPAPSVELLEVNPTGPVLAVRPSCPNDHYWNVYFAANQVIAEVCFKAG